MKYSKPQVFRPSEEDVRRAMSTVAAFLSPKKQIGSVDFPELKERGKRKSNNSEAWTTCPKCKDDTYSISGDFCWECGYNHN